MPRTTQARQARNIRRRVAAGGGKTQRIRRRKTLQRDNISGAPLRDNKAYLDPQHSRKRTKFRRTNRSWQTAGEEVRLKEGEPVEKALRKLKRKTL